VEIARRVPRMAMARRGKISGIVRARRLAIVRRGKTSETARRVPRTAMDRRGKISGIARAHRSATVRRVRISEIARRVPRTAMDRQGKISGIAHVHRLATVRRGKTSETAPALRLGKVRRAKTLVATVPRALPSVALHVVVRAAAGPRSVLSANVLSLEKSRLRGTGVGFSLRGKPFWLTNCLPREP
jgi:hypothetical protein